VVDFLQESLHLSQRRACGLVGLRTATYRYRSRRPSLEDVRERLRHHAAARPRFGYRRLGVLLDREGHRMNHKKLYRLYKLEHLAVRRRKRKKRVAEPRVTRPPASRPNARWSMDFTADALACGRAFRTLNIVDDFTRECLALEVDVSLPGARVVRVLERLVELRGKPEVIVVDNGPEFAGRVLDAWAYEQGVTLAFIRPGKPVENAFVESFNGRFRDECLNMHHFRSVRHARNLIEAWRQDDNEQRPHSSLGNLTPEEFATRHQHVA